MIQALPTYAMSVFLLPMDIPMDMCKEIKNLMCRYWWKADPNSTKGVHWASWDKM